MNAKTLEAVRKHGETLLMAFPNATEKDPVALCKKLRRVECSVSKFIMAYTNGETVAGVRITQEVLDQQCEVALTRTAGLLGLDKLGVAVAGLFVNRDPRGYALKVGGDGSSWLKHWQEEQFKAGLPELHHDWGQYGIIAPDLTPEE